MRAFLFVLSAMTFLVAVNFWVETVSAIHQILTSVWLLISAVFFCSATIGRAKR